MLRSFFELFTSQHYANQVKAASVIQKYYRTHLQNNNDEKIKLMKVMNDTISSSYDVVTVDKNGKTVMHKEHLETTIDDDSLMEEYEFYLLERKRIKQNSLKLKNIVNN